MRANGLRPFRNATDNPAGETGRFRDAVRDLQPFSRRRLLDQLRAPRSKAYVRSARSDTAIQAVPGCTTGAVRRTALTRLEGKTYVRRVRPCPWRCFHPAPKVSPPRGFGRRLKLQFASRRRGRPRARRGLARGIRRAPSCPRPPIRPRAANADLLAPASAPDGSDRGRRAARLAAAREPARLGQLTWMDIGSGL